MNKISLGLCLLLVVQISWKLQAQTLESNPIICNQCTLSQWIETIEQNTSYKVAYSPDQVNTQVQLNLNNETNISDLLNLLTTQHSIDYGIVGQTISLYRTNNTERKTLSLSGYIEDEDTGERLVDAHVYNMELGRGTSTNAYGYFSIKVPSDVGHIYFSYSGYQSVKLPVNFSTDSLITIRLKSSLTLSEVTLTAKNKQIIDRKQAVGLLSIPLKKIATTPVILGETDILKTAQLFPGISEGSEGNSGLYVRGGSPDQNLILLDGITVYNPNHLFGFFSVFNTEAIKDMKVLKGGFPARYGGRLSSVIDLTMKEGNNKKVSGGLSVGLISSKAYLEGPLGSENTSFFVSGRRTYIDLLGASIGAELTDFDQSNYYFYDLNAKVNHKFNDKHRLYLSYYSGKDEGSSQDANDNEDTQRQTREKDYISWGNSVYGLRWNWLLDDELFLNTTVSYSAYDYLNSQNFENSQQLGDTQRSRKYTSETKSGIHVFSTGLQFNWYPIENHQIRFGGKYFYHEFNTGVVSSKILTDDQTSQQVNEAEIIYANEANFFLEDQINLTDKWEINVGTHYSLFDVNNTTYHSVEPRLTTQYNLNDDIQLNAGMAIMQQYTQLLSFSRITLSSDIWVPVTDKIKPARSHQVSSGFKWFVNDSWSFSTEGYYKQMTNVLEYKDGASLFRNSSWQDRVVQGDGKSYGLEFLLSKNGGKFTGWIAYTLAQSTRQFEGINQGKAFPYKYDRRHDVNIVMDYKLTQNWSINAVWVFRTGNAETLGVLRYPSNLGFTEETAQSSSDSDVILQQRNNYRMPAYHRLDLSLNWKKRGELFNQQLSLGVYNAYNYKNPYKITLIDEGVKLAENQYVDTKVLDKKSLFGILPAVSYTINF